MSIKEARDWFRRQGDETLAQQADVLLLLAMERHGVEDVPPVTVYEAPRKEPSVLEDVMQGYREAWNGNALTPELVDRTWLAFWTMKAEKSGFREPLEVPLCDRTAEELAVLRDQNRGIVLLPDSIMTLGGLEVLSDRFPNIRSNPRGRISVMMQDERGGCVDVEMDVNPPYINSRGTDVKKTYAAQGLTGQRLQTYIVASYFSKLLTGNYFDEQNTESGLLGSRRSDGPIDATMDKSGQLSISFNQVTKQHLRIGFRSEGRKRG